MKTPIRVLIVDDSELTRRSLIISLLRYGCDIVEAPSGAEALELMAAHEFDVSFIDLKLPDLSGIDLLTVARNRGYAVGLPVVMTGEPKPSTSEDAKMLGATFLQKPMEQQDIRAVIGEAVPGAVPAPPQIMLPKKGRGAAESSPPEVRTRLPRLLVLDDNPAWLEIMKTALGNEFDLELTSIPKDAIEQVAANDYELVILDMKLPETSGLEVLRRMRELAPDVRAIILTAYDDDSLKNATQAGQLRALEYVKKEGATLAEKIRQIQRENPRETRVFFCYTHRDRERVADYYERLTRRGFQVFRDDESITGGKDWELTISDAIKAAHRFVFFLSRNSYNRSGPMRFEINQALRRQDGWPKNSTFFIPARLEECGIEKDIRQFQVVDVFRPDGFARLLKALITD